ncbi:hypothetical protein NC652_014979 [Populus alba x Populus x berolinensis]|nr:hypothetical protein NC652_014979 [Populus alba x Populus x berolinensis]
MAMGFKFFVLEGNARPGGRVKTMKRKGEGVVAVADVGASVLTGINGNPHGVLARKMGLHLHKAIIEEVKSVHVNLGNALEAFTHVYKVAEDPQELMMILVKWGGDHCFIPGGNGTFVIELAKDLPIFYERTVGSIGCGIDGVIVYASGREFLGGMVLCTVLSGVLEKGSIEFVRGALLIALVAGDAAVKFETMSPVESVKRVLVILRVDLILMLQKGLQETIMILAGSVGDGRVFFAREATSEQNPATMHGAFLSWMMKAASMLRVASRRPLAVIDKANNGLEEIDDLNEVKFQGEESDSCFLCLHDLVSRKQAAVELSELQDDGNVGSKGLSSAGGESLVTYIKEA